MEVLEAFDLTKSYRAAGQLVGVDHHTVARAVAARSLGQGAGEPSQPAGVAEAFADKIAEWIDRSGGKVRADVVHDKLVAMGYSGSERTTRRVVATMKKAYRHQESGSAAPARPGSDLRRLPSCHLRTSQPDRAH